jgi:hypothetical protein
MPTSALTLTEVADGRVFQRVKDTTSGPVSISGTYTGDAPVSVEARVLLDADDSEVVGWTVVDAAPAGGTWSGSISTPQGGAYYVAVRCSDQTGVGDTGTTTFFVGMWLVLYGQSNMGGMSSTSASPPAAAVGTGYYDGTNFIAVPAANGVRELLNALKAETGIPVAALSGAVAGVTIAALSSGHVSGHFTNLSDQITEIGGDAEFIVWHQGEGDADGTGAGIPNYVSTLSTLHTDICALTGRTKAQMPLVLAGLATQNGTIGTDASWDAMQGKLLKCRELANVYYSHSNMDAVLTDGTHYTGASYGRAGKRYAQTIADILGTETASPAWFITSAERINSTTTDVTVAHSMGSDFTPTSGITGFEVSDDNGNTWTSATGARASATKIRLTHSAPTGSVQRLVRYQYGRDAGTSALVVDNSALSSPLVPSGGVLNAGGNRTAAPRFLGNATATGSNANWTAASGDFETPAGSGDFLVIVCYSAAANGTPSSVTFNTSGVDVVATSVEHFTTSTDGSRLVGIVQGELPAETAFDIDLVFAAAIFGAPEVSVWAIPVADLVSTTATASATATDAAATSVSVDNTATAFGFTIAGGVKRGTTSEAASISGDGTYIERVDRVAGGARHVRADSSALSAGTETSTITFASSGVVAMVAATWETVVSAAEVEAPSQVGAGGPVGDYKKRRFYDGESWAEYVKAKHDRQQVKQELQAEVKELKKVEKQIRTAEKKEKPAGVLANLEKLAFKRVEIEAKVEALQVKLERLDWLIESIESDEDDEEVMLLDS